MWYMKPVLTSIDVPNPREQVFDFLDVMANHEPFTNHMLKQWEYSGPDRGIGSKARVQVSAAGRTETVDIEVVSAERPEQIVERNVGLGGRRIGNGTYTLEELPEGRHPDQLRVLLAAGAAQRTAGRSDRPGHPATRERARNAAARRAAFGSLKNALHAAAELPHAGATQAYNGAIQ